MKIAVGSDMTSNVAKLVVEANHKILKEAYAFLMTYGRQFYFFSTLALIMFALQPYF